MEKLVSAPSQRIPLGMGTPEDIAATVVFLANNEAKHITGAVLDINGGVYFR
jgi:3-oxoacyl-[acyl-carrier protein] reductase